MRKAYSTLLAAAEFVDHVAEEPLDQLADQLARRQLASLPKSISFPSSP